MPAMAAVAVMRSLLIPAILSTPNDPIPEALTEQAVVVVYISRTSWIYRIFANTCSTTLGEHIRLESQHVD
jgi:hypothetical protein